MNPIRKSLLAIAVFCSLAFGCASARALTVDELAGTYQGTSVATLPNGATFNANLTVTFKRNGKIQTFATVNGQTIKTKGKYQFASDDLILGNFPTGEFVAFVDVKGETLTFTILARSNADGSVISERTTATLIKKL